MFVKIQNKKKIGTRMQNSDKDIKVKLKRNISSTITKIYDRLGLLRPVIIIAKRIMQKLWKLNKLIQKQTMQLIQKVRY